MYDVMNMLFQFGIFLAIGLTALIAMIALVTKRKKKSTAQSPSKI